jgi:hypothetical protein
LLSDVALEHVVGVLRDAGTVWIATHAPPVSTARMPLRLRCAPTIMATSCKVELRVNFTGACPLAWDDA